MTASAAARRMQDVALLFDLFKASGLIQLDLRTSDLELYVARDGVRRRAAPAETHDLATDAAAFALKAPHIATLVRMAGPGERVAAGRPWATIAVLGAETVLTHDYDITVRAALAAPGTLVEYGARLLEAETAAPQPASVAP